MFMQSCVQKKGTKWCKSHSSGSQKDIFSVAKSCLPSCKRCETCWRNEPQLTLFPLWSHHLEERCFVFICLFRKSFLRLSSVSQSVRRCFGLLFFFLFIVTAAIPPQKNLTCSRESFMQRDSPHSGRSELIRRITCQSRPPRGSRGAAAIRHRSPACWKDSSSGLLAVRLPPSAEDCGSITHHRAAHRHWHTRARTQPLHTLNAVGKLLKPPHPTAPPHPPQDRGPCAF